MRSRLPVELGTRTWSGSSKRQLVMMVLEPRGGESQEE